MLALFHIKEVKMTDYTAIQELLTRVMKWKTFQFNISPSLWHLTFKDVGRNKVYFFTCTVFNPSTFL